MEWEWEGNGERNGGGNGREGQRRQGTDRERRRESWTGARRPTEGGRKKSTVGGERSRVPGVLRRKKCRLDSALTISETGGRRFGIGTPGNVPGQHGTGHLPGDKVHRWDLHP